MAAARFTKEQIEGATQRRLGKLHNFLHEHQATPMVVLCNGHVGERREEPEPLYWFPEDVMDQTDGVDWVIMALEDALRYAWMLKNHGLEAEVRSAPEVPGAPRIIQPFS